MIRLWMSILEEPESKRMRQTLLEVGALPIDSQVAIEHGVTVVVLSHKIE